MFGYLCQIYIHKGKNVFNKNVWSKEFDVGSVLFWFVLIPFVEKCFLKKSK